MKNIQITKEAAEQIVKIGGGATGGSKSSSAVQKLEAVPYDEAFKAAHKELVSKIEDQGINSNYMIDGSAMSEDQYVKYRIEQSGSICLYMEFFDDDGNLIYNDGAASVYVFPLQKADASLSEGYILFGKTYAYFQPYPESIISYDSDTYAYAFQAGHIKNPGGYIICANNIGLPILYRPTVAVNSTYGFANATQVTLSWVEHYSTTGTFLKGVILNLSTGEVTSFSKSIS